MRQCLLLKTGEDEAFLRVRLKKLNGAYRGDLN